MRFGQVNRKTQTIIVDTIMQSVTTRCHSPAFNCRHWTRNNEPYEVKGLPDNPWAIFRWNCHVT